MTRAEYQAQYGTLPPAPVSSAPAVSMTRQQYQSKYGTPFGSTYNVPPAPQTKEQRVASAQSQANAAKQAADKANSPLGFAANFGKALISNIAPSEVGLGKSIGTIADTNMNEGTNQKALASASNDVVALQKLIKQREAAGQNADNLKRMVNDELKRIGQLSGAPDLPTTGEVLGQLGGTALDTLTAGTYGRAKLGMRSGQLASKTTPAVRAVGTAVTPALGKVAEAATTPTGLFTRAGATNVAKGAGIGYGYDVTQGLQGNRGQDRTGGAAFIPGLGTALGAAVPALTEGVQSVKNLKANGGLKNQAVDQLEQTYQDLAGTTQKTRTILAKGQAKTEALNSSGTTGKAPARVLAEAGIVPTQKGTRLETLDQAEAFRQTVAPLRETNRAAIKAIEPSVPRTKLSDLESKAIRLANSERNVDSGNAPTMVREIRRAFAEYRASYGKDVSLTKVDDIKSARWGDTKFDSTKPLKSDINYLIGKAAQQTIETTASAGGFTDVAQLNREIGSRLDAAQFLQSLNGKTLKGGRLQKYVFMGIGASFGNSLPAKVIGALGGDAVANMLISNSVAGPVKRLILKNLEVKDPEAYRQALAWLEKNNQLRDIQLKLPPPTPFGSPRNPIIPPAPTTFEKGVPKPVYADTQLALPAAGQQPIPLGSNISAPRKPQ